MGSCQVTGTIEAPGPNGQTFEPVTKNHEESKQSCFYTHCLKLCSGFFAPCARSQVNGLQRSQVTIRQGDLAARVHFSRNMVCCHILTNAISNMNKLLLTDPVPLCWAGDDTRRLRPPHAEFSWQWGESQTNTANCKFNANPITSGQRVQLDAVFCPLVSPLPCPLHTPSSVVVVLVLQPLPNILCLQPVYVW